MSFEAAEKIADAVLFEGYMLYPYRPSALKNQQRWNFGTLYPRSFAKARRPPEPHSFHTEILLEAAASDKVDLRVRFLVLVPQPHADPRTDAWEIGVVRARTLVAVSLDELREPVEWALDWTALSDSEKIHAPHFYVERPLMGWLQLQAFALDDKHFRIEATFSNESPVENGVGRKEAQAIAFTSAHLLLHCTEGAFVSLLDPPPEVAAAAAACRSQGVYPVLAGDAEGHTMLCSPIILYDFPQIAPESGGDFFDATEMDEMLALRVLTLTDAEKREMRESDPHARAILERVEAMADGGLRAVHGTIRDVEGRDVPGARDGMSAESDPDPASVDGHVDPWNPFDEAPALESVRVFGVSVRKGDRVRLWPQRRADIMDAVMEGRVAIIEAIEQDLEGNVQLAVVLEDDPGKDMGLLRQAGHRFFFSPDEVEPLTLEAH